MKPAVILAIIRKDIRGLWPLVLLTIILFCLEPVVAELELNASAPLWETLKSNFYWLSYGLGCLLLISVLQQDPADSLNHDWLTRPIAHSNWVIAKLLFLLLTLYIPMVLARFVVNWTNGLGLALSLSYAMTIENLPGLLALPILVAVGLKAATLRKAIVLLVLVLVACILPAWNVTQPLFDLLGVNISEDLNALMWLQALPTVLFGVLSAIGVYWSLYCQRKPRQAALMMAFGLIAVFFSLFPPRFLFGWDSAIAVHQAMLNEPDRSVEDSVVLDQALACFPAATVEGNATSPLASSLLAQANWTEKALADAGPGAITLASRFDARNIAVAWFAANPLSREHSVPWLLHKVHVSAQLEADSLPNPISLAHSSTAENRFERLASTLTDYWLLPSAAMQTLRQDSSTRLVTDFEIGVLAPTAYALPVDARRHLLPDVGSCRAIADSLANTIEVDCLSSGPQPALISAALIGIPSSRVDSRFTPRYTPDWLEALGRSHFTLTLEDAGLVPHAVVQVNAYELQGLVHRQIVTPGILGGPLSLCPPPGELDETSLERSTWADRSPHESSLIAVEQDVRVEVLDWRGPDDADKPVLLLLPGLGGTAHSFDALAPRLAEHYGVVAMTRRGIGASSKPGHGYDIARLGQDILQVLNTLAIDKAVLVGHSVAGDELSYLGAEFPDRFNGLIYLDAAYDRSRPQKGIRDLEVTLPPAPPPRQQEFLSYENAQAYGQRIGAVTMIPEGEILASYDFATGANKHVSRYLDAIEVGLVAPDYTRIPLPALSVYAMPSSPDALMESWYDRNDPRLRETVETLFAQVRQLKEAQIAQFEQGMSNGQVLVLPDADHWIFVSHEQEVLEAMERFLATLF